MKTEVIERKKPTDLQGHSETARQIAEWFVRRSKDSAKRSEIAQAVADIVQHKVLERDMSGYVSQARFVLERTYGKTLVYSPIEQLYVLVKKGSKEASRFTMTHYRRAVLSASRARELDELGFLNRDHIDELVEEVMAKATRRSKDLGGLKQTLTERWKALRTKERKALTHDSAAK